MINQETDLELYTHAHLHTWALMGFRFIICEGKKDYHLLTPCLFEIPHALLTKCADQYMIPIGEEQSFEMADGVDEVTFYTQPIENILACVMKQNT